MVGVFSWGRNNPIRSLPTHPFHEVPMSPRFLAAGAAAGAALMLMLPPPSVEAQEQSHAQQQSHAPAQSLGQPATAGFTPDASASASNPDFLFRQPRYTFTVRSGLFSFRANDAPGTFFDVTTENFTTDRSDFRSLQLGAELAVALDPRLDLTIAFDGGSVAVDHESRIFEEVDGTPIFQSTRIRSGPAAQIGLRGYVLPRGEQISSLAWVPARVAPFVGAGAGYSGYDVRQWGDFAFTTAEGDFIQYDDLTGSGGAGLLYASGGADVSLRRNLALTLEARYQWSESELGGDFRFSDPTLDLSGLRLTAGLSVRF
ncbi:MAG: hypothetical protein EA350_10660 [Gemmatimonadales bacterium]|nr:MAG: hypothetical protein EA350_10660 [Gemmatimonadales bacterium]